MPFGYKMLATRHLVPRSMCVTAIGFNEVNNTRSKLDKIKSSVKFRLNSLQPWSNFELFFFHVLAFEKNGYYFFFFEPTHNLF